MLNAAAETQLRVVESELLNAFEDSHRPQSPAAGDVHVSPTASYYRPGVGAAASGALGRAPPTTMCTGPLNAGGSAAAAGTSAADTSNGAA
jgi:hypothetical protein